MEVDLLIKNGKCLSMDGKKVFDWLAIKKEKIVALGTGDDYSKIQTRETIDACGSTVMPGFIDSHFHMVQTAVNSLFVDLSEARNFYDIGDLIREEGEKNPEADINGIRIDESRLKEKRLPNRKEIDSFWNDTSVWLNSVDYLTSALNTYAMLYYKIPFNQIGVEYDCRNMPTGIFRHNANYMLRNNILNELTDFFKLDALQKLMPDLAAQGLTTVNVMEGGRVYSDSDAAFINRVIKDKLVYLDMELFFQTMDLNLIQNMGLKRVGGCMYVDGTFNTRTAAISFDYKDAPGVRGNLHFTQDMLDRFVLECYERNNQLALYTIGDRAIDMALKAHEKAFSLTGNKNLRHRLEHVELPCSEHISAAAEMGIIFSMQPTYEAKWGGPDKMYANRLGDFYKKTNPFRSILDGGVKICGGTDSDLTEFNYIHAIYNAVNHPTKEHRVTLNEALRMFTADGAYAIGAERKKGMLKEGLQADIIILDGDISICNNEEIKDLNVAITIKSGRIICDQGRVSDAED